MNKLIITAVLLMMLSLVFGLIEMAYFGWNLLPQSPAEAICDIIMFAINGLGVILIHIWFILTYIKRKTS